MDATARVEEIFHRSLTAIEQALDAVKAPIVRGGGMMADALADGGKILLCGNGGSASDSLHFSSELLNRFERERRPLPAISLAGDSSTLTSVANDYDYSQVFSKQIEALGTAGDVLLAITTSGNSPSIVRAVDAAQSQAMPCVVLNGRDGGVVSGRIGEADAEIRVPGDSTARIQEVHGIIIHCLCDLIDHQLFGNNRNTADA
ncbi:MAG: SIS domain-containing protein [Pseudomonadota bacterium]|nr:SIS domain-containing protein [Pseudomonadota bacterium]